MVDEEYTTPHVPLERQLIMARFAYHKQMQHKYLLKMQHWGVSKEHASEEYRKSMENYDQILGLAVKEPERIGACVLDMGRGFVVPGQEND